MKEKPILFSAPMVRAILEGRKTQTRRVLKQANGLSLSIHIPDETPGVAELSWLYGDGSGYDVYESIKRVPCPYGQHGDRLRVKESAWMWCERRPNGVTKTGRQKWHYAPMKEAGWFYSADHPKKPSISVVSPDTGNQCGWRLKIGRFLPAWASRITLEVVSVRVERLNDISDRGQQNDCTAEGVFHCGMAVPYYEEWHGDGFHSSEKWMYRKLWESINGPGSWEANPWVWVIEFKRIDNA